nr:DUF3488 and transglutaminase-like domain-containing protein [Acinetobacter wanghuae]
MNADIRTPILLSLSLILLTQVAFLAVPLSVVLAVELACLFYYLKKQKLIPKKITFLLTLIAVIAIYSQYKSFIGVDAGVAVLTTFMFAKALESKNKRDFIILFNFALFVAASSFLYSQSFWMALAVLLCLLSCMVGLYRIQVSEFEASMPSQTSSAKALLQDLKHVGRFVALAFPFFILLFMFFPRLPPLWHIPIPENKAVTGISDSMSPGDIASLSQSSALAFRIIGDIQRLPKQTDLYWRALVLDEYDGQKWTSHFVNQQPTQISVKNTDVWNYQYLAADTSVLWIMGLDQSIPHERYYFNRQDGSIVPRRLTQRVEPISLQWVGTHDTMQQPEYIYRINTKIQSNLDLKSQQLATRLYSESQQDAKRYIQNVLNWYRQNNFVYTLNPGILGHNRIDDFLFNSRQGFCEHYASSFVMLMRFAGIPARVVTGYQGGQLAPDGKSWEVRQLDAHAWTEVLLDGQWQRIDPTAVISAQRIENGMQTLMQQDASIFGQENRWSPHRFQLLTKMRIWGDYASYQWQSKVVGYNSESQQKWFEKLGLKSTYMAILTLFSAVLFLMLLYFTVISLKKRHSVSSLDREIDRFNKQLSFELKRQSNETFRQWLQRISLGVDDEKRMKFMQTIQIYDRVMYAGSEKNDADLKEFKGLLKYCAFILKNK